MKKRKYIFGSLIYCLLMISCQNETKEEVTSDEKEEVSGYAITPVNIQHVRLTDEFWLPWIQKVQEKTIEYVRVAGAREDSKRDGDELCVCRGCYDLIHTRLPSVTYREPHTDMCQYSEVVEELTAASGGAGDAGGKSSTSGSHADASAGGTLNGNPMWFTNNGEF